MFSVRTEMLVWHGGTKMTVAVNNDLVVLEDLRIGAIIVRDSYANEVVAIDPKLPSLTLRRIVGQYPITNVREVLVERGELFPLLGYLYER